MIGVMTPELHSGVRDETRAADFSSWMLGEQRRIFLLCRRMLQDAGEADSATQDIFLKAYRGMNSGEFADVDAQNRWLTRVAVNACLDRLRSKTWKIWQRRPTSEEEATILRNAAGDEPDAERQMFSKQIQQRLEVALQKLSARQRSVFVLRHHEGLALEEIASILRLDEGTIKAHLFRAVAKLRVELKDLYFGRAQGT